VCLIFYRLVDANPGCDNRKEKVTDQRNQDQRQHQLLLPRLMSSKIFDGAVNVFVTRCHWERPVTPHGWNFRLAHIPLDQPHLAMAAMYLEGLTGTVKI